jgi:hypothetical protein
MARDFSPAARDGAVRLTAELLSIDDGEQPDVLALTCRMWCYHRERRRQLAPLTDPEGGQADGT